MLIALGRPLGQDRRNLLVQIVDLPQQFVVSLFEFQQ